jgi:formylglycine-generating enzyme required for sulfatase activity
VPRRRGRGTARGTVRAVLLAALLGILAIVGEGAYWAHSHGYHLDALPKRWAYAVGLYEPWPRLEEVPAGSFTMGAAGSGAHRVNFARPSYVAATEITFEQYDLFAIATGRPLPSDAGWGRGDRPAINVGWSDAGAYATWLTAATGNHCRLPSEAEWEYACRAGTTTEFALPAETQGSDDITGKGLANCKLCGSAWDPKRSTAPVGSFKANGWGLHDMHGNVWEWAADCWHDGGAGTAEDGRQQGDAGAAACPHALRGGSWNSRPAHLPCAYRLSIDTVKRLDAVGFRVVCSSRWGGTGSF